jgi:hypothetical protein
MRNKTREESYIVVEVGGRRWGLSWLNPVDVCGVKPEGRKI